MKSANAIAFLACTMLFITCSQPTGNPSDLATGSTMRKNVAGDYYSYTVTGYITKSGQTAHLGTLTGTMTVSVSNNPSASGLIQSQSYTLVASDGSTVSGTAQRYYDADNNPTGDSANGTYASYINNPITDYHVGASGSLSFTLASGKTTVATKNIIGTKDIATPVGTFAGAWEESVASSDGSSYTLYLAPQIGGFVQYDFAIGASTATLYATALLKSYVLGSRFAHSPHGAN